MRQITDYIEVNKLLPAYQSAYRKNHGVETAMLKMYSDPLNAVDNNQVTAVITIDLGAAFDTVDIPIVLNILHDDFGIKDTPLKWFESYLTQNTMKVVINNTFSESELLIWCPSAFLCEAGNIYNVHCCSKEDLSEIQS